MDQPFHCPESVFHAYQPNDLFLFILPWGYLLERQTLILEFAGRHHYWAARNPFRNWKELSFPNLGLFWTSVYFSTNAPLFGGFAAGVCSSVALERPELAVAKCWRRSQSSVVAARRCSMISEPQLLDSIWNRWRLEKLPRVSHARLPRTPGEVFEQLLFSVFCNRGSSWNLIDFLLWPAFWPLFPSFWVYRASDRAWCRSRWYVTLCSSSQVSLYGPRDSRFAGRHFFQRRSLAYLPRIASPCLLYSLCRPACLVFRANRSCWVVSAAHCSRSCPTGSNYYSLLFEFNGDQPGFGFLAMDAQCLQKNWNHWMNSGTFSASSDALAPVWRSHSCSSCSWQIASAGQMCKYWYCSFSYSGVSGIL